MEKMDDNVETSSSCKWQRVREEQVEDRITSLLDSLLLHILSFLPTQDAVRTVLVPSFRHLWQFLTTFTFDYSWYSDDNPPGDGPYFGEKFLNFARHVLVLHQNSIDKFVLTLGFNLHYSKQVAAIPRYKDFANREKRMASEVDSWVYFAMKKKVNVLDLDFVPALDPEPEASYRLPSVVFREEYLVELKLACCEIKPGQIQLNCLKRLFLEEIVLNDEIRNKILDGCSVLEELSLIRCYGLCRLGFRNSSIKSLTLFHDSYYQTRLEISCPNIESLNLAGGLDFVDIVDVSYIVVSSASFTLFEYSPAIYKTVKALLKSLGHCKAFRLCDFCIMV